jgi:hypothetical protein
VKLLSALATAAAAILLTATPAIAVPPPPPVEGPVTGSFVLSTGLVDGQLIGNTPRLRPVFAEGVTITKVEVWAEDVLMETFTAPLAEELVYFQWRFNEKTITLTVRAWDDAGNIAEAATRVTVESRAPLTNVNLKPGQTVSGVVTIQFYPRDPDMDRIEVRDAAGNLIGKVTAFPWKVTWDTTGLNGPTTLSYIIRDLADNNWDSQPTYIVDNAGPAVTSITPAEGSLVSGTVTTSIEATDPSGITSATVRDGQATDSPYTWTVTPAEQGPFTIVWTLADKFGNTTVAERTLINDTVSPRLKIKDAPRNRGKLNRPVHIKAKAWDLNGVDRVELLVDGEVVATDTESAYRFTLDPKDHGTKFAVRLRAYDRAGNVTTSSELTYRR